MASVVVSGDVDADGDRLILPLVASGERFGSLELVSDSFSKELRMNAASSRPTPSLRSRTRACTGWSSNT